MKLPVKAKVKINENYQVMISFVSAVIAANLVSKTIKAPPKIPLRENMRPLMSSGAIIPSSATPEEKMTVPGP